MADRVSYGPFTLYESDAYKQAKQLEGAKKQLEYQKALLDVEEKLSERPESKISKAAELYQTMEQMKQQQEGIPFGDVARKAAMDKDMNLLEASKQQGLYNVEQAGLKGKMAGIEAQLMGQKSLAPTATVSMGGVRQQALQEQVGQTSADTFNQIYQNQVPQLAKAYMAEGFDNDTAYKMAAADTRNALVKDRSQGKVTIMSSDMTTSYAIPYQEARRMWEDPQTPAITKTQLNKIFGESEQPKAQSWIQTRLGK
jgi:hypothetical protein